MIDLTCCMVPRLAPALTAQERYLVLYGGAGSGKSVFASQKAVLRCLASPQRFAVFRKVARTLRQSVFRRVQAQCSEWKIPVTVNKTEMIITFGNGSEILFLGLDDAEKIKSIDGITSIWIEEATEISEDDFATIDMRLRGETPWYKQIMLTFNPVSHTHWLKQRFFDTPGDGNVTRVIKSTFLDNPFLDEAYRLIFEDLKRRSPSLYRVYGEGEWGIIKGLIFEPPTVLDVFPDEFDLETYGLDFGFNNPSALVWMGLRDVDWKRRVGNVYVRELIYERELSNAELGDRMRAVGVDRQTKIYADSAEPARIKELSRQGFRILPSTKGKGSVQASIALCQSMNIYSLASNTNFNAEMMTYCWEEDKDGKLLDKPVALDDHAIAGMRYGLWSTLKARLKTAEAA